MVDCVGSVVLASRVHHTVIFTPRIGALTKWSNARDSNMIIYSLSVTSFHGVVNSGEDS